MSVLGQTRADSLQAKIDSLRSRGAERIDPLRLVQLQALARRLTEQPEPVRVLLREKVEAAMAELAQRLDRAPAMGMDQPSRPSRNAIRVAPHTAKAAWPLASQASGELASVSRFRRVWSSIRAHDSVLLASSQKPSNAGPLNSHALVVQSLDLMRALPGDYLRRFVAHAEALLWLEATGARKSPPPVRKTKRQS